MKRWPTAVALALTTPILAACGSDADSGDDGQVTIGVIYDGSGPSSGYSKATTGMLEWAVGQVNEGSSVIPEELRGGGAGINGHDVVVKKEDDGGDPNRTVSAVRKLIGEGADVIMFGSGSASAIQGRVVCQQEEVLCVVPNNSNPGIIEQPNADYVFMLSPAIPSTAEALLGALKGEGYQTLAYISDDGPSATATKDAYQALFEEAGLETVADEVVPSGASDVTAQVSRVRGAKPDAIFDVSFAPQVAGLVYRTTAELMPSVPRWSTNVVPTQPESWEIAGDSIEGLYSIDMVTTTNPYTKSVADAYKPGEPFFLTEGMAWDSVMLVKHVIEKTDSTDGEELVSELEEVTDFPSAHGQPGYTLNFGSDKHDGASANAHVIVQFDGGGFVPADSVQQPE
jgi:branched-chain amino acid transport system substrate-binding protein